MTLSQLYRQCRRQLTHDTADFDLSQLFHAQFERSPGLSRAEAEVADDEAFVFRRKVKRLAEGYPLQYLLGEWEFYSIPLKVGEGVLIPRPDTETLVDAALALAARMETPEPVIADFCAGSGAIALALARHLPGARLLALELSPVALDYLRQNVIANRMGGRIDILEADVLEPPELPPLDM
ncbi:MAG: HemK/PrmC family methyltransferase, partial [Oscillospiraceae bacterium]